MMFHSSHIHMPHRYRQRSALRTFFPSSSFSPPDSKEPLRRGILFSSVATVLLLVGAILTWLGFNDVFGGKISMTGPLLIALALLMMLLSLRQFMLARKRNRTANGPVQMETMSTGGVTAVVVDHDDGNGAATIVVEAWDSEEPNNDDVTRNNCDLAPPSYMDIAHSVSSTCPSFLSHEDRNEAPPTYEETCGDIYRYHSETSINTSGSRRCSSQLEGSPSPNRTNQPGQGFFQNDYAYTVTQSVYSTSQPGRSSNTLCPTSQVAFSQNQKNPGVSGADGDPCSAPQQTSVDSVAKTTIAQSVNSDQSQPSKSPEVGGVTSPVSIIEWESGTDNKPQWSRRSFSSIPSYTCLLSESGEVSAQVFDTSSIIEEMMPSLEQQGSSREPASNDLLTGPTVIPTRSHSMSSMNTLRQGVPYDLPPSPRRSSCNPVPASLLNQPLHDQQSLPAVQIAAPVIQNITSQITKSPSFPLQESTSRQGSDINVMDVIHVSPLAQTPLQPQPARLVNSLPGSTQGDNISLSQEAEASKQELPLQLQPGTSAGGGSVESVARNMNSASEESSSTQGKLRNTQDIQETI